MNKKEYFIWISGSDMSYTTKSLTGNEAELVESVINELDTQYEGCGMEVLPEENEIAEMSLAAYPEKPTLANMQDCLHEVDKRYNNKCIFWKEHVASMIYNYTNKKR